MLLIRYWFLLENYLAILDLGERLFFNFFLKERRVNMADWDASSVNSPAGTTSSIFSGKLLVTIR